MKGTKEHMEQGRMSTTGVRSFFTKALEGWKKVNTTHRIMLIMGLALIGMGALVILFGAQTYQAKKSRTVNLNMENISELSTQAAYYTNVQVIRNSREVFGITVPFTQSQYIYSYDGVVKAGIDFSKVKINVDDIKKQVTVAIPVAYITSNEVDEDSLEIYDESKNIFSPLKLEDFQTSQKLMEEEAEKTAVDNGLLEAATENAKLIIEMFVKSEPSLKDYQMVYIEE